MKKLHFKSILACAVLLMSGLTFAQVSTTNTTDNSSCDGAATLLDTTNYTSWTWMSGNTVLQTNGSVVQNLCVGSYSINLTNGGGDTTFTFVVTSNNNPCANFGGSISSQAATSPTNCNGVMSVVFSGGTAPYTYSWTGNGTNYTTQTISNLCPNTTYTVNVIDANGCQLTVSGTVSDSSVNTIDSLYAYPYPTNVSEDNVCDGSVDFQTNAVAPYQIYLSNGQVSSTGMFTDLCQGIYTAVIIGANSDSTSTTFIISNPSNNFSNPSYADSTVIDSLVTDLQENCQVNYANIDSVYVASYTFDSDSLEVVWLIVEGNTTSTQVVSYPFTGQNGVYSLGLNVYCPGKTTGNYFSATDRIAITSSLGLADNLLENIKLYPVPMQNELNIALPEVGNYEVKLIDLMGRTVFSSTANQVDFMQIATTSFAHGSYTLIIQGQNGQLVQSVIK